MGEDGGEVRGVLRVGGKEGRKLRMGGWDRVRGFILHSFVEPASRTTIRRENRALRRAMSVKSNEMQSTVRLMRGRNGTQDGGREKCLVLIYSTYCNVL